MIEEEIKTEEDQTEHIPEGKFDAKNLVGGLKAVRVDIVTYGVCLKLGDYYLWIDTNGDLRKHSSEPTSDTAGTVVLDDDTVFIKKDGSVAFTGTGVGFRDEDDMASDDATAPPSQQSVKKFVEDSIRTIYEVSDNLQRSNDTEASGTNDTYALVTGKEIDITNPGVIRVKFDLKASGSLVFGRIYVNDVAVGTERSDVTGSYVTFSEDITVVADDVIQIYAWTSNTSNAYYVRNFRLYWDEDIKGYIDDAITDAGLLNKSYRIGGKNIAAEFHKGTTTTLYNIEIPANTLGTNGVIRYTISGLSINTTTDANECNIQIILGSTTISTLTVGDNKEFLITGTIANRNNAASQIATCVGWTANILVEAEARDTAAEDTTSALDFYVKAYVGNHSTENAAGQSDFIMVEILPS